jgi:hypothetical protein
LHAAVSSVKDTSGPALQPDEFAVGIRLLLSKPSDSYNRYVDIYLKGTVAQLPVHAAPSVSGLSLWVDRSNAGPSSNTTYKEGGPVPLPVDTADAWLLPNQQLQLSVWVDHSVIEVFGMGGLARVTSRVYPDDDDVAWGVSSWVKLPSQLQVLSRTRQAAGSSSSSNVGDDVSQSVATKNVDGTGGIWRGLYCWWCKLWFQQCSCQCEQAGTASSSSKCASRTTTSSSSNRGVGVQQQQQQQGNSAVELVSWVATTDGAVWEVHNAWLPPSG